METSQSTLSTEGASAAVAPGWHIWVRRALLVIFGINMVLTVALTWTHNQIADTDRFVRTVSPLVSDPAIQEAIVVAVTSRLDERLVEFTTRDGLFDREGYLAAPISAMLSDFVEKTVRDVVSSDEFAQLWDDMTREIQPAVSAVLTGSNLENGTTSDGKIVLNLAPIIGRVADRLTGDGINLFDGSATDRVNVSITVVDSPELSNVQDLMAKLDRLTWIVPFLALIALAGYLWLSPDRRIGFAWLGLCLALSMALFLLVLSVLRWRYLDRIPSTVQHDAMAAFFDTVGHYLRLSTRVIGLLGLAIALIAVIARPGGLIAWVRHQFDRLMGAIKAKGAQASASGGVSWVERNRTVLLGVFLGILCLALIGPDRLSQGWGRSVVLLAVVGFALIWFVTRREQSIPLPASAVASLSSAGFDPAPVTMQRSTTSPASAATGVAAISGTPSQSLAELAADLSVDDQALLTQMAIALHKR